MTTFAPTVLTPEQRAAVAADDRIGGGNLLRSALAVNPAPNEPFIHAARPITTCEGETKHDFSLAEFDALAQSWSAWYLAQGVQFRDRVAVWFEDSISYSLHFYALAQIGAVALLINSNASKAIATSLIEQTSPVGLYADRDRLDLLGDAVGDLGLAWVQSAEELPAPPAATLDEASYWKHHDEDPVAILHSSGTTGRPKPTIHTHRSIVAGPKFRLVDHVEQPGSVMMTALPQSHLGCVAFTVFAVLGGTPIVALSDGSGEELAAAVLKHRPTAVMSFAHGYAELANAELEPGAVDSVDVWVSIGDAVHQAHITKVLSMRSTDLKPSAFYDRLGTTELGWGALLKIRTLDSERNDRCAGKPVGVSEVTILRRDGSHADDNEIGHLAAKGPAITPGYWGDSDTTYRYKLSGYWLPGDMAYRDSNGDYFLVDRAADAIHTESGTGYSVFMEEVILNDVPDTGDVAVIAGRADGRVVPVAVVTVGQGAPEPEKLLLQANEALAAAGHPLLGFLEIVSDEADFPVGVTGKVLKRRLREKYEDLRAHAKAPQGKSFAAASGVLA
ncbi:AMP-binding protein [Streptomyces pluripotens]|uniref:AMP-binding protein n=1 Tax=Streptomyces pluripotens TaxID=1355015 RepID=A0A221P547_9ACTN|nr:MULTISPECIES: class I adenylate-forming enzyme family protein [Streptomyces]ARP73031.1 AMP-binding protein [Streptomyces pluripotens]ASN27282.1 AMP-binding protein [Streptomyces pluripotens]MCH0557942.1 acyl--CoA ligase [Streptomyces sp. MUM 16J]